MRRGNLLFISDQGHLDSEIPGGVQICTQEYMDLLEGVGFNLTVLPVSPRRDIRQRALNRIFPDPYRRYDASSIADRAVSKVADGDVSVIAINQVNLLPVGAALKNRLDREIKILALSHGNESGDTLHEILRRSSGWFDRLTGAFQLGRMLIREARLFTRVVDLMLCMSEMEQQIDAWLGVKQSMVVPRTFAPDFLDWSPVPGRSGFVGTLNHLPNQEGILRVLSALERQRGTESPDVDIRIVGGPGDVGRDMENRFASVTYCGHLSQKDFRREAATWGLFLNPIWWYARGATTKLAQAVNWGIPVVTTTPGMRGYTWSKGSVQVTDTPDEMASLLVEAARKPKQIYRYADDVRTVARSGPTIEGLSDTLDKHLSDVV